MSVYSRESVVRRHNGVFNRGHLDTEKRNSKSHLAPPEEKQEANATHSAIDEESSKIPLTNSPSATNPASSGTVLLPSPSSVSPSPVLQPSSATSNINGDAASNANNSHPFTPVPAATNSPSLGAASSSSGHGLSSGAIGAIVTLVILFVAAIAAFVIRKVYMHRRELRRTTWGASLVPALQTKRSTIYGGDEKKAGLPSMEHREKSVLAAPVPLLLTAPGSPASPQMPLPPPQSYNSTPSASPVKAMSPGMTTSKAEPAMVVRTFIPSLPDELNITTGEHIRILTRYDDGWALCCNIRNEQGVVPLECLQRADTTTVLQLQPQSEFGYGSDKSTKRLSSLVPNKDGTY